MGNVRETATHNKKIGYLVRQYWDLEGKASSEEPAPLSSLFDEFKAEAEKTEQPCWPVKHAAVYYTYNGGYYKVGPGRLDCTQEVFEVLADRLIDRMYELGAYDMFYSGMLD